MLKTTVQNKILKTLPDDRPITSIQVTYFFNCHCADNLKNLFVQKVVESIEKCPVGFVPVSRTYDQDQDADLWREGSFFKRSSARYLCLSKSEGESQISRYVDIYKQFPGLPGFIIGEIIVLNEKAVPPEGYSLLHRTVDSEQKAWRKRQLCYRLAHRKTVQQAVTDIIVCSRLKKAPDGFTLAGYLFV